MRNRLQAHPQDLASWALILRSMVARGAPEGDFLPAITHLERLALLPYDPPWDRAAKPPLLTLKDLGL